jgi:hypothetical protein
VGAAVITSIAAAPAAAQDPGTDSTLSDEPPVHLAGGPSAREREDGSSATARLAETGAEPGLVATAGLGLLLAGAGLRIGQRGRGPLRDAG